MFTVAFFEAFGSSGVAALERLRADLPADLFVILDAKRGDIGPTAERYAAALFGHLAADAVTLSPYLGEDAIEPFLEHEDRVVYVLARTSNASAGTIQDLPVDGAMLHERVARWVAERWPGTRVAIVHRTGRLEIGETSVVISVSAPRRADAFEGCRHAIERLKESVPIWKKEFARSGAVWLEGPEARPAEV